MVDILIVQISSNTLTQINQAKQVYLAYSGGLDSHVLLHLCASNQTIKPKLTVVHIHHGLQKIADDWVIHCQQQTQQLGVNYKLLQVNARKLKGKSPEETAREARYHALKKLLAKNEVLLVAQHREDQLETVLLQLFRGAGIQGLSAMAEISVFGKGKLLRPLLDCSQQSLKNYALKQQLNWVEDPSNQCNDFERNFLRNKIVPLLKTHWQALDKTVARSAKHCANAQQLLTKLGSTLLIEIINRDNSLSIKGLLSLQSQQQALVIRQWFAHLQLKMPSMVFIEQVFKQMIAANKSANPILKHGDYYLRRYQDKLYCLIEENNVIHCQPWLQINQRLQLSPSSYLQRIPATTGIPEPLWEIAKVTIRYRTGGEKIALVNRKGHHRLKKLFQEAKIPPWEREQIPLIYFDDKLIAVADLWISSELISDNKNPCYQLKWQR